MKPNRTLRIIVIILAVVAAAAVMGTAAFFITLRMTAGQDDPEPTTPQNAVAAAASGADTGEADAPVPTGTAEHAASETAAEAPVNASPATETIVDIFLENRGVWETALADYALPYAKYGFLDLDFDGVPELIIHHSEGSGLNSDNRYYRADIESGTVTRINGAEEDFDPGYDLFYTNEEIMPRLLKHKDTGELYYYCADASRGGIMSSSRRYGTLKTAGDRLLCELLFSEETEAAGEEELHKYEIIRGGNPSETEAWRYEQTRDDFFFQHEDMNLRYQTIDCSDYHNADEAGKRAMLLDSCKAFQYDGFSIQ